MNSMELDRLFRPVTRKIVSAEITAAPGRGPDGMSEHDQRVTATLDDGSRIELFAFNDRERSFNPTEFVGLSVEGARRLQART